MPLAQALARQRRLDTLRRAGRLVVDVRGTGGAELVRGRLVRAWADGPTSQPSLLDQLPDLGADAAACGGGGELDPDRPIPKHLADELQCVASWLDDRAPRVRIVHCDEGLSSHLPLVPSFTPTDRRDAAPRHR